MISLPLRYILIQFKVIQEYRLSHINTLAKLEIWPSLAKSLGGLEQLGAAVDVQNQLLHS